MFVELAGLPIPTAAVFEKSEGPHSTVQATYSIRDHVRNAKRTVTKTVFLGPTGIASSALQDVSQIIASLVSPSGARRALLRETPDHTDPTKKKRHVEIWLGDYLEASQDVTDVHGSFYADDYLSTLSFSPSESALLYTAEANGPKEGSPFDTFRFVPQFGEGLSGKKRPTTYLFRWRDPASEPLVPAPCAGQESPSTVNALSLAQRPPTPVMLGQAVFAHEDLVFATGYEYTPEGRALGVKGCFNRPSGIWQLSVRASGCGDTKNELACDALKLTPSARSCRTPRVLCTEMTHKVFWVSNAAGGAHASCVSLHCRDLRTDEDKVMIDTVFEPGSDGFPGLYLDNGLPPQPFLDLDGVPHIVLHSTWGSRTTVLLVSTANNKIVDVTPEDASLYSWTVLSTDGKAKVLCARSGPTTPHELVHGQFDGVGKVTWTVIDQPKLKPEVERALSTLSASVVKIPDRYPTETIVLQSMNVQLQPMITMPHGGPHATATTGFSASNVSLALEGYTLSLPNYTGSLGFGEKYVRKLLGQCGSLDVEDCISSVRHLVKLGIATEGPGKLFIQGGSHGGFLTAHLIGQHPTVFSAAVLRNPVINTGELSISDIPDWYFEEFGLPFTETSLITPEIYSRLFWASPISHVDAVVASVLLLVGEDDLRVAPMQGISYYHALKGRGKTVELLCFQKESHPLDGVESLRVGWEAARDWFKKFCVL